MIYKETQSLLDLLLKLMPDLQPGQNVIFFRPPQVNSKAAKALMSLWKNEKNIMGNKKLKRPANLSSDDLQLMEKENLVQDKGDFLEITSKGEQALKTMILGDERSVFEDDGKTLDFHVAQANTKPKRRLLKGAKRAFAAAEEANGNWYRKIKH